MGDVNPTDRLSFESVTLRSRTVDRHRPAHFQRAEVGRLAGEAVGDVRQRDAAIDRRRSRLQPEVEILRLVEALHGRRDPCASSFGTFTKTS